MTPTPADDPHDASELEELREFLEACLALPDCEPAAEKIFTEVNRLFPNPEKPREQKGYS